jgi:hypothetical protein
VRCYHLLSEVCRGTGENHEKTSVSIVGVSNESNAL